MIVTIMMEIVIAIIFNMMNDIVLRTYANLIDRLIFLQCLLCVLRVP